MEIYDYATVVDKISFKDRVANTPKKVGIRPIFVTSEVIEVNDIIIINNVAYVVLSTHHYENETTTWCTARELKKQSAFINEKYKVNEANYKEEVTCPYCGYEEEDSWEMDENNKNYECQKCGSIFSYQRVITVEYCSQPVKRKEVKKLN